MKYLLLACLVGLAVVVVGDLVLDNDLIEFINSGDNTWTAHREPMFEGMTISDAQKWFGVSQVKPSQHQELRYIIDAGDIPKAFNAFDTFKFPPLIKSQEKCGSCWAFSATSTLGYRFCKQSGGKVCPNLAAQDPVSCDWSDMGCYGGMLPNVWNYMQNSGVVTDVCLPYTSGNGTNPFCEHKCTGPGDWSSLKHYAQGIHHLPTVQDIQADLFKNGPVQVAFSAYQDFMTYKGGVYQHKKGAFLGGHAVTLVGWGETDNGTPYWIMQNSFSEDWGIKVSGVGGFFYILRGKDECGIENDAWSGLAKLQ